MEVALIGDVDVHSFREDKNYIVDVAFQQAGKTVNAAVAGSRGAACCCDDPPGEAVPMPSAPARQSGGDGAADAGRLRQRGQCRRSGPARRPKPRAIAANPSKDTAARMARSPRRQASNSAASESPVETNASQTEAPEAPASETKAPETKAVETRR